MAAGTSRGTSMSKPRISRGALQVHGTATGYSFGTSFGYRVTNYRAVVKGFGYGKDDSYGFGFGTGTSYKGFYVQAKNI